MHLVLIIIMHSTPNMLCSNRVF